MALDPSDFTSGDEDIGFDSPEEFEDSQLLSSQDPDVPRWCYTEGLATKRSSRASSSQPLPKRSRRLPVLSDSEGEKSGGEENYADEHGSTSEIGEMKGLLKKLCDKVEANEKLLRDMQKSRESRDTSFESDSSSATNKRLIPKAVRQEVRSVYNALCEKDDFEGWSLSPGKSFNSKENSTILDSIMKEVQHHNPRFNSADIRNAAYRYYRSKCEEESNRRRGLETSLKVAKRRRERVSRKKRERESAIQKNGKMTPEGKTKWMQVMRADVMSSEDSDDGGKNIIRPLLWRSEYVDKMFNTIDQYYGSKKSVQARRQTKERVVGEPSTRPAPEGLPNWAIKRSASI